MVAPDGPVTTQEIGQISPSGSVSGGTIFGIIIAIIVVSNIVYVHRVDDLPAPVDGVINLAPDTDYHLMNPLLLPHSINIPQSSRLTTNPITIVGKSV